MKFFSERRKIAMAPGQIFIYSLSLIIVSMILIYGYNVITDFIGDSSQVEMLQFKKTLEGYVKSYSTEYGSSGVKSIVAPNVVSSLCFTDFNSKLSQLTDCRTGSLAQNPKGSVTSSFGRKQDFREKKNVFFFTGQGEYIDSEYLGNFTLHPNDECNYLCMDSKQGRFSFRIQGRGDHAVITSVN